MFHKFTTVRAARKTSAKMYKEAVRAIKDGNTTHCTALIAFYAQQEALNEKEFGFYPEVWQILTNLNNDMIKLMRDWMRKQPELSHLSDSFWADDDQLIVNCVVSQALLCKNISREELGDNVTMVTNLLKSLVNLKLLPSRFLTEA